MANTIRLKRASGSDPGASDLVTGELAVRTDTGKLFTKKDDNSVAEIGVTGNAATATKLETARTIAGVSFDGSANISLNNNAITNGAGYITATLTNEQVQDIVGGMLTGNTETGITVTYQDGDGTIDFVVGTLNQDTTGNAATATALETARNIGGVSFDGTGNINLPGVNTSGNQNTSGNAATATALATARNIAGVSFDGTANISLNNNAITNGAGYITDLLSDTSPQLGGNLDTNSFEITLDDDHAVKFGDSGDLEIYHLSSSSINVIRGTLPLTIQTDDTSTGIKLSSYSGGETFAQFKKNGAADLYHDNSLRFSTSASGAEVHGDLQIDDNNKIKFGDGGDLEIFHDGSDSYLREAGTGGLKILTNNFSVNNAADSENIIHATQDGAVQLYHNGTEMIKTTSSGIELAKSCQAPLSALSDGSTITVDFSTASHFSVTLGGNRTFGDPSNVSNAVGSSGSIFITQDGTGSRTASFHSDYKFVGGTAPTLSTAANAVDRIDYVVKENHVIHCAISLDVK